MKVAYVTYLPYPNLEGIKNKIKHQARAAFELGLDMDFLTIIDGKEVIENNYREINFNKTGTLAANRKLRFYRIYKTIDFDYYDVLIIRYPHADISGLLVNKKYGHKIISEHHTDEESELKLIKNHDQLYLEYQYSRKYLKNILGVIGVTKEISKIQFEKSNNLYRTIGNGVLVDNIAFTQFALFDGEVLNIAFVASSFKAKWRGLDLIFKAFQGYNENIKIVLKLIGHISEDIQTEAKKINTLNKKVLIEYYGALKGKLLDKHLSECTIAFSNLALFRKNITEGSTLKAREYLARGLPFVYGYYDFDIDETLPYVKRVNLQTENLNLVEIIEFAKNLKLEYSELMRKDAYDKIDYKKKIQSMYDVCQEFAREKR